MLNRRLTQLTSLILLHSSWGPQAKWFCNPVLSCHSCSLSWFACPVGVFVHYSGYHLFPWLALGTVLLTGVLAGRLFCGWVCPFGFLQDMLHRIPSPKIILPRWTSNIKYIVLAATVGVIPFYLGEETMLSFCRMCPASAIQVTLPYIVTAGPGALNAPITIKLGMLAGILLLASVSSRSFCKTLCPIGAMLAPLNHISILTVKPPEKPCISCRKCDRVCPTGVEPSQRISEGIPANRALDCIVCHECRDKCALTSR